MVVEAVSPNAEYQAGGFAVAVALKADAPVQVKQQAVAEMRFQFFLIPAPAGGPGKISGVGGHGTASLGLLVLLYRARPACAMPKVQARTSRRVSSRCASAKNSASHKAEASKTPPYCPASRSSLLLAFMPTCISA